MKKIQKKLTVEYVSGLMGNVASWLLSTVFIWWGWSVLAPHLNAPLFSYWEIFAMRMALSCTMKILWQK